MVERAPELKLARWALSSAAPHTPTQSRVTMLIYSDSDQNFDSWDSYDTAGSGGDKRGMKQTFTLFR